jgi:ABC-type nitrate/sulfonate/bicarbonate transport system substrate-binding protein
MIIKRLVNLWIIAGLLISVASAAAAQDKVKFSVGVGTKTLGTSLLWLANQEGFLQEVGLDVQPVLLCGTHAAVQALVGESLYITMSSADAMVSAAAGGADLVSVAGQRIDQP